MIDENMIDEKRMDNVAPIFLRIIKKLNIDFRKIEREISYKDNELKLKNQWLIFLREAFVCYLLGLNIPCISTTRTALESFMTELLYNKGFTLREIEKESYNLEKKIDNALDQNEKAKQFAHNIRRIANKYIHFNENKLQKYHKEGVVIEQDSNLDSNVHSEDLREGIKSVLLSEFKIPYDTLQILENFVLLIESI